MLWQKLSALAGGTVQWFTQPMERSGAAFAQLRELTVASVLLRLLLAVLLGGALGLERGRKNRPAGFRTHMLVCMGAALAMILGQYTDLMAQMQGRQTDMTRIGAQVINGIGFLGAGTILVTEKQQVKGLTTAAGLWASACMGLALGAGFYECVLMAFCMIVTVVLLFPKIETFLVEKSRNMEFYAEVTGMEGIHRIIDHLKRQNIQIYDVEINRSERLPGGRSGAAFSVRLGKKQTHTMLIEQLSRLDVLYSIKEL